MLKEDLARLLKLQELDNDIRSKQSEADDIPAQIEQFKGALKQKQDAAAAAKKESDELAKKKKLLELEVETHNAQQKRLSNQLNEVKSNKEYAALQQEINHAKEAVSKIEEEIIGMLLGEDELKQKLAKINEEAKAEEAFLKTKEEELKAEAKKIEDSLKGEIAGRNEAAALVEDKKMLAEYDKIRAHDPDGIAAVPIASGSCGGCNTMMRAQEVIQVLKCACVIKCENCGRILCGEK